MRDRLHCGLLSVALLMLQISAFAANAPPYPFKPLRIVVGFPAGSGTDMLARFIGGKLTERVGHQIVVDNRPGANGIIAAELTVKAPPDGYTMQFMSTSHTMNAAVYKLPFEPVTSFTPVMQLGAGPLVLVANPAFAPGNTKALIELATAKPNTVTYAISGTGGVNHFAGALFSRMTGTQLINVPYKGGPQALTDLIGGQVQVMFGTAAITLTQVRAGRLKALGVSTVRRSPLLPDIPTIAESGVPGYEMSIWWGVLAPAATPPAIVDKLYAEIVAILKQPESAQRLAAEGAEPSPVPSAAFARLLNAEVAKWQRVAREANIKAD
jgi:tripartite-type tricarboxylate transporter receptor subunit TctC